MKKLLRIDSISGKLEGQSRLLADEIYLYPTFLNITTNYYYIFNGSEKIEPRSELDQQDGVIGWWR